MRAAPAGARRAACPCSTKVPFSRWSCRLARAAACGSWVTMIDRLAELLVEPVQQRQHFLRALRVELAGGLVEQDQRRVGHDRARDRDPLLLAARELARVVVQPVVQPDDAERDPHPLVALLLREPREQQRQLHVLERGEDGSRLNDWNTNPTFRERHSASCAGVIALTSAPPTRTCRWWACRARR